MLNQSVRQANEMQPELLTLVMVFSYQVCNLKIS
ncbi:hypothetical protein A943_11140 [Bacillus sp. CPSM8]|nr:hypothetical protein A943_11140 [Bacillus sp. CPSM8]